MTIVYDDLSDEDKQLYEESFITPDGEIPESIESSALNDWVFNDDTIRKVFQTLFDKGIKIDYGNKIGKTIIFAKNHLHAEKIYELFNREFPSYPPGFCRVIDNYTNYVQSLIDEFSDAKKLPQIAVSVDMLDTGIDVPEVVNLVFFKKVMSKAKFWQMIGRGTRLCPGLIDGSDKKIFHIFDFCGNFEFFRMNGKGRDVPTALSVQERIFDLKVNMIYKLQDIKYQTEELTAFRNSLIDDVITKINELNKDNFAVKQHLRYVEKFSGKDSFAALTPLDIQQLTEEIEPLVLPFEDEINAVRFDALMYAIELAEIIGQRYTRGIKDLMGKVRAVSTISTIPEVLAQKDFINQLLNTSYVDNAGINEFELIRVKLRDLIKYIPHGPKPLFETDITDDIISLEFRKSDLENDDLQNYKMKVNYYIRQHMDNEVIAKLHTNQPLIKRDISELEKILWSELGTKDDYTKEYKDKPLGELVREIVGLDMNAANAAFSKYLDNVNLDDKQIYFVKQIINYIVKNGMMKDFSVMQESPFTDKGTLSDVFTDMTIWLDIKNIIKSINANAAA